MVWGWRDGKPMQELSNPEYFTHNKGKPAQTEKGKSPAGSEVRCSDSGDWRCYPGCTKISTLDILLLYFV